MNRIVDVSTGIAMALSAIISDDHNLFAHEKYSYITFVDLLF